MTSDSMRENRRRERRQAPRVTVFPMVQAHTEEGCVKRATAARGEAEGARGDHPKTQCQRGNSHREQNVVVVG